MLDVVMNI